MFLGLFELCAQSAIRGKIMPFRSVTDADDLAKLRVAFNAAWSTIEIRQPVPPHHVLFERDRLGHIVFTLWHTDRECDLIADAVEQFLATAAPSNPEA
jgi:hypothetical protein